MARFLQYLGQNQQSMTRRARVNAVVNHGTTEAGRHLTMADVCRAIANGELPAKQRGQWYAIRKRDVVDYASRSWAETSFVGKAS